MIDENEVSHDTEECKWWDFSVNTRIREAPYHQISNREAKSPRQTSQTIIDRHYKIYLPGLQVWGDKSGKGSA